MKRVFRANIYIDMQDWITRARKRLPRLALRNLRFLVLREGRSGLHQFELSGRNAFRSLIAILILIPTLFYLGSHLLLDTAHSHRVARLRKDNVALYQLVAEFEDRIGVLQQEVAWLSEMDQDLRAHANLPDIPAGIRQVGIGGSMVEVSTNIDYLLPGDDVSLARTSERLDDLYRRMKLEQLSYESLRDSLKNDRQRLRVTPSIIPVSGGKFISGFGLRRHPVTQKYSFHSGQDISVKSGTTVHATADGKVVAARWDDNLGLYVKIDHGNGFHTLYGHLYSFNVDEGQRVKRDSVIGKSGNTGRSTNPHLHYEVRLYHQRLAPRNFF